MVEITITIPDDYVKLLQMEADFMNEQIKDQKRQQRPWTIADVMYVYAVQGVKEEIERREKRQA